MENTIIAQSSVKGQGAIAVIRMSGENAIVFFEQATRRGESLFARNEDSQQKIEGEKCFAPTLRHSQMQRFYIYNKNNEVIDDVMASVFFAPKSFTGENVVEIFCHGSQITVERILKRFLELGAVIAGRGEFTKRAFLNGKINLHKAEAINAVISAKDYYSHKNAMNQYMGQSIKFFDDIHLKLQQILVDLESKIEFSETDELDSGTNVEIQKILSEISQNLIEEKRKYGQLQKIRNGIPTVLVGRTNAGKSSLFNKLLNENRAIVNSQSGTTRDVITETVEFGEIIIRLFDTAGLNESTDEIENEGIKRTHSEIERAFVGLWVISPDNSTFESDYELLKNIPILIAVLNKNDLGQNEKQIAFLEENGINFIKVSTKADTGIDNLINILQNEIENKFPEKDFNTTITGKRELNIMESLIEQIEECDFYSGEEIMAEQVRQILKTFEEIYGFLAPDEIMNKIFDNFCIGK